MDNNHSLKEASQKAYQHIVILAQQIGARPAGSPAEKQAFDYIAGTLRQSGYEPVWQPVSFAPVPRFFALYTVGGLLLALSGWGIFYVPALVVLLPLLVVALPQIARWLSARRRCTQNSQNLVAYQTPSQPNACPTLIFCAHVDSSRASAITQRPLMRLYGQTWFVAQRAAIALAALAALQVMGFSLPEFLKYAGAAVAVLVGVWWIGMELLHQLGGAVHDSPGAYDNASGVGVVLALAQYFASHPPTHLRLGFLFTGAEETGMHGARTFAASIPTDGQIAILNLDMVGAGNTLTYVTADGTLFLKHTDPALNSAIRKACPAAVGLWYTRRSGDFLPFLQSGIPAASLQTSGSALAEFNYHTIWDTLDVIQPAALEMVLQTIRTMVEKNLLVL